MTGAGGGRSTNAFRFFDRMRFFTIPMLLSWFIDAVLSFFRHTQLRRDAGGRLPLYVNVMTWYLHSVDENRH
jgi:hypothetical protein